MRIPQAVRFVVTGIFNTLFAYGVYAALIFAGLGYATAYLLALIAGIIFSFNTQSRFVFGNTGYRRFPRFVISWAIIYVVSLLIINRATAYHVNAYVSGALTVPVTTVLSYALQRFFVFRASSSSAT